MQVRKSLSLDACELKFDGEAGRFSGYASVFGGKDSYGDTILKGAFETTLRRDGKPKMFYSHDAFTGLPIGKWLSVKEDDKGLHVDGELTPNLTLASDVHAALKHGTLDGLSIGGYLKKGDFEELEDGGRIIKKWSRLIEVSPVAFPADAAARIDLTSVKSEIEQLGTIRDFERFLRDAGFSTEAAKTMISRAKELFAARDADDETEAKQMDELAAYFALKTARV